MTDPVLEVPLKLPDLWQQEAIRALHAGRDVVVDAPTGAGKTYIFELLVEHPSWRGRAVYTVPTRALANDKLLEWRSRGWQVGIATGDLAENLGAPIVVATLETQKGRLLRGDGPSLLVVDEYQMLADPVRGVNYELALALAPADTQLLLLSGTVGNPAEIVAWLRRLGRQPALVQHRARPVPQEEVLLEALPDRVPPSVRGLWPRFIARALMAGLGPILVFAPRRRAAEDLAHQLRQNLPMDDPLLLTPEQERLAGDDLARLLKSRLACHHSGLSYLQRAGLIEPLAKAGQLRVVVATTGLAAGINFSLRSVLVTDREYRAAGGHRLLRPDELQQMFGRAGRRGLDEVGYVLAAPGKPRLPEGRSLRLQRPATVEWASLLAVMQRAVDDGQPPQAAAEALAARLFTTTPPALGFDKLHGSRPLPPAPTATGAPLRSAPKSAAVATAPGQAVVEIWTPAGRWERKRAPLKTTVGQCLAWGADEAWHPAPAVPAALQAAQLGPLVPLPAGAPDQPRRYGRELPLARFGRPEAGEGELVLVKPLLRLLHAAKLETARTGWTLELVERELLPRLPALTGGTRPVGLTTRGAQVLALLDLAPLPVLALPDASGQLLLFPPERTAPAGPGTSFRELMGDGAGPLGPAPGGTLPVPAWRALGLIDSRGHPTRRGVIFSFFNHGEGLAVAAALEDSTYDIAELARHLANLRAGHRFGELTEANPRLAQICRQTYRAATYPGYLEQGVPPGYGDGAAEALARWDDQGLRHATRWEGEDLRPGDVERAALEWRSLLRHIAHAPPHPWERWQALQAEARRRLGRDQASPLASAFPELTPAQRVRYRAVLRF